MADTFPLYVFFCDATDPPHPMEVGFTEDEFTTCPACDDHVLRPVEVNPSSGALSPAHALQAARAMEFAATLNKRPDLYVFGAEFREAGELLERLAGGS